MVSDLFWSGTDEERVVLRWHGDAALECPASLCANLLLSFSELSLGWSVCLNFSAERLRGKCEDSSKSTHPGRGGERRVRRQRFLGVQTCILPRRWVVCLLRLARTVVASFALAGHTGAPFTRCECHCSLRGTEFALSVYQPNVTGGIRYSWILPVLWCQRVFWRQSKLHKSHVHSAACYSVGSPFIFHWRRSESGHALSTANCVFAFTFGRWRSLARGVWLQCERNQICTSSCEMSEVRCGHLGHSLLSSVKQSTLHEIQEHMLLSGISCQLLGRCVMVVREEPKVHPERTRHHKQCSQRVRLVCRDVVCWQRNEPAWVPTCCADIRWRSFCAKGMCLWIRSALKHPRFRGVGSDSADDQVRQEVIEKKNRQEFGKHRITGVSSDWSDDQARERMYVAGSLRIGWNTLPWGSSLTVVGLFGQNVRIDMDHWELGRDTLPVCPNALSTARSWSIGWLGRPLTCASQSNLWPCPRVTRTYLAPQKCRRGHLAPVPAKPETLRRHTFLTAVASSRDVAASHPFNCCCEQQRRLFRVAEILQHSDGQVGGASTSRVVPRSSFSRRGVHRTSSRSVLRCSCVRGCVHCACSVLRCSCASRWVLRTSSVPLCFCASGGVHRTSSVWSIVPAPAVSYAAPARVDECLAPAPALYAAPAPVVKYMALDPIVGAAPVPVVADIS